MTLNTILLHLLKRKECEVSLLGSFYPWINRLDPRGKPEGDKEKPREGSSLYTLNKTSTLRLFNDQNDVVGVLNVLDGLFVVLQPQQ